MALEQAYMSGSLDLLERIEAYSANIRENVEAMTEMGMEQQATMQRIATASEATKENTKTPMKVDVKSLGEIGTSVKQFADGIIDALPKIRKVRKLMKPMATAIGEFVVTMSDAIGDKDKVEAAEKGANIINILAGSLLKFVGQIALATPLLILISPMIPIAAAILGGFIRMLGWFAGKNASQAEEGANVIKLMGDAIFTFAWKMALSLPLLVLALPAILVFEVAALLMVMVARTIMSAEKDIDRSGNLIREMGISILIFTAALALSIIIANQAGVSDLATMGMLILVIGAFALAFWLIGSFEKNIKDGAIAIIIMSLSIILFALTLAGAVALLPPFTDVLMLTLTVVVVALAFFLAGMFKMQIIGGAIAMALVGLSLLVLSLGLAAINAVVESNPQMLWQLPLLIIGLGAAFALAGIPVVAGFIMLGAAALGVAGLALISIGLGIQAIMKPLKGADEATISNIENVLKSVINGFGKGFSDLSLTEALTLPLKIPMVALMGFALMGLGAGLNKYMKVAGNWGDDDTETLSNTISGISKAFATAGSSEGMSKLFGFNVGKNDTERGIDSTMRMGKNLNRLAKGIAAWKKLELDETTMQLITDNIMRVLNTIPAAFASIGARERESKGELSFLGLSFVNPFQSSDIELGIEATEDLGGVLRDLAEGVAAWKNADLSEEDTILIAGNIQRILNTIPSAFAAIGKREKGSTGKMSFFGMEFNNPFSSGDIEAGIESVKDLGSTLVDLADGVKAWKSDDMALSEADMALIQGNISNVLNAIPELFAAIGNKEKDTRGWFGWGEGDIEAGIAVVEPMGKTLKSIADGVKVFSPNGEHGMSRADLEVVQKNISDIMSTIPKAFAKAGTIVKKHEGAIDLGIKYVGKFSSPLKSLTKALDFVRENEMMAYNSASGIGLKPDEGGLQFFARRFGWAWNSLSYWISKSDYEIQDKHIKSMTKLVKPLKDLTKIFPDLNREFEIHMKFLSDLDGKTVDMFAKWADALEKLSNTNMAKIEENGFFSRVLTGAGADDYVPEGERPKSKPKGQSGGNTEPPKPPKVDADVPKGANASDAQMIKLLTQMVNGMNSLSQAITAQTGQLTAIKQQLTSGTLKTKEQLY